MSADDEPAPSAAAIPVREWSGIDQAHCDFAAGVLASLSIVVLHLAMRDAVGAEKLRDELKEFAAKATSVAGATAPKDLAAQITTFLATRDTSCFRRSVEIAREQGRLPSEGQGSA
jgi:hypothetical protein